MTRVSAQLTFVTVVLWTACVIPLAALAGTGSAVSAPTAIDSYHPVLMVQDPPPNTLLQGGQTIGLTWAVNDDNPSSHPAANVAEIYLRDDVIATHLFAPGIGQHSWEWTIPDLITGSVHLVVRTADTFGNLTTAQATDFTILSSVTDVPPSADQPVFARLSPNPFNPLTNLHFNLPENGPVQISVHDARGFRIGTLLHSFQAAGDLTLQWDGTDNTGRRQAGGTYFFRLEYTQSGQTKQAVRKGLLLP